MIISCVCIIKNVLKLYYRKRDILMMESREKQQIVYKRLRIFIFPINFIFNFSFSFFFKKMDNDARSLLYNIMIFSRLEAVKLYNNNVITVTLQHSLKYNTF